MKAQKSNKIFKDKKKARNISVTIHMALLFAAVLPFTQSVNKSDQEFNPIVEIVFSNTDISSGKGSIAPAPTKINNKSILDKVDVKIKSIPEIVATAPILENTKSPVKIETLPELIIIKNNAKESTSVEINESSEEVVESKNKNNSNENAASETDGEGDDGAHIDGKTLGEMDFDGEGVFGRKVVFHADVAGIAERNGRVVINLCINRNGMVTHVAYNKEASTILDSDYIKKALIVASDYLFESDYSAPKTQCGKLSFIYELK